MERFEWKPDLEIDGSIIDTEHRRLFELANQILEFQEASEHETEIAQIIKELFDYVQYHFEHEEELMQTAIYPQLDQHHDTHQQIIQEMIQTMSAAANMSQILENFRDLMQRWVVDHIRQEDTKIRDFLRSQGAEGGPELIGTKD